MSNTRKLFIILTALLTFLGLSSAIKTAAEMSEVHRSYATGECLRVVEQVNTKSPVIKNCDNMPEHYNLVWVK